MKRLLTALALSLALAGGAYAQVVQGLDGRWEGSLDTPDGSLPVVMRVATAAGKTTALLDSPTQNANDIPATAKKDGAKVTLDVAAVQGSYEGTMAADGKSIAGTWSQSGMTFVLVLTKK
jgi:uncharacterized protein